ncbi:MAG TPA: hypothetical protein VGS62_02740 [Streptosporangiaceae bacterium]|nr:hypothetical protein [Streptosporangiaceae bacterium]
MNPYILQLIAEEHTCDLRRQATLWRRARLARRTRRPRMAGRRPGS